MRPLSPLAVAALGLLVEREQHPYEMFQTMLHRREDRVVKVSAGTLYRTVERLAADGLIAESGVERDGNRPERTRYAITEAGRAALVAAIDGMLGRAAEEYPEFVLAVGGAHNLPADRVAELLGARRAALGEQLASIERSLRVTAELAVPRAFLLDLPYRQAILTAEIAWIDRTVAELADGGLDWPAESGRSESRPPTGTD